MEIMDLDKSNNSHLVGTYSYKANCEVFLAKQSKINMTCHVKNKLLSRQWGRLYQKK